MICVHISSSRLRNLYVREWGRFHEADSKQRYQAQFGHVGSPHRRHLKEQLSKARCTLNLSNQ